MLNQQNMHAILHSARQNTQRSDQAMHSLPLLQLRLPVADHALPVTDHVLPVTGHELPDTSHALPGTRHELPDIRHVLPDTSHELPDTSHALPDIPKSIGHRKFSFRGKKSDAPLWFGRSLLGVLSFKLHSSNLGPPRNQSSSGFLIFHQPTIGLNLRHTPQSSIGYLSCQNLREVPPFAGRGMTAEVRGFFDATN